MKEGFPSTYDRRFYHASPARTVYNGFPLEIGVDNCPKRGVGMVRWETCSECKWYNGLGYFSRAICGYKNSRRNE